MKLKYLKIHGHYYEEGFIKKIIIKTKFREKKIYHQITLDNC